jgi:hypothetical protein
VTDGEVTTKTGKSYFVFYPPIFVYNLLISDSWSSPSAITLFGRGPVGPWAYSTIHGLGRLFVKARPGPGPSTTARRRAPHRRASHRRASQGYVPHKCASHRRVPHRRACYGRASLTGMRFVGVHDADVHPRAWVLSES